MNEKKEEKRPIWLKMLVKQAHDNKGPCRVMGMYELRHPKTLEVKKDE